MSQRNPRLLVLYHFFHPDQVVSARIFSEFSQEQVQRGWDVTALTSNRSHGDVQAMYPAQEEWNGVHIRRVFRPPWSQKSPIPRLANSAWTLIAWLLRTLKLEAFDAVVIGSDPSFAASLAIALRALRPRTPILHWCLDLFPDAGEAEWTGASRLLSPPARALMGAAYRRCDAVIDLGSCMRQRLERYGGSPRRETLTPWALVEPARPAEPDPATRRELFGDAKVGLLYAGSMARSHDYEILLQLARACRALAGNEVVICFACTGTNLSGLKAAVRAEDTNVRFAPFADESRLQLRLESADFHLGSLRREFTGIVVPSKFFAALAVGRQFVFAGSGESAIARWIVDHGVGMLLDGDRVRSTAARLVALKDDPSAIRAGRDVAFATYGRLFSKKVVNDRWSDLLRAYVTPSNVPVLARTPMPSVGGRSGAEDVGQEDRLAGTPRE